MFSTSVALDRLHNVRPKINTNALKKHSLLYSAIKEERFRFGNGYDQVEDVMGVAQPVRFNSKRHTLNQVDVILESLSMTIEALKDTLPTHPQRNAPPAGTTTKRQPAATRCTCGARTTGRL